MRISLCTNCMGRRSQLEQTLPHNLSLLRDFPAFELVLIDYNSRDGLADWILAEFPAEIASGRFSFYRTADPQGYVMTHAKNVAHLAAAGEIVTNLDGDNFLTAPYLNFVENVFSQGDRRLFIGFNGPGIGSRISVRRDEFIAAGGYDEDLGIGWGPDDFDLALRLHHLGLQRVGTLNTGFFGAALEHPDSGRNELTPEKLPKQETHARNLSRIIENARCGKFVANAGRRWGAVTLTRVDGSTFSICGYKGAAEARPN